MDDRLHFTHKNMELGDVITAVHYKGLIGNICKINY